MCEFTFFSALSSFLADLRNVLSNTRILRVEWFSTSIKVCFLYSLPLIINPADSVFDSGRKFHYLLEVVTLCAVDHFANCDSCPAGNRPCGYQRRAPSGVHYSPDVKQSVI